MKPVWLANHVANDEIAEARARVEKRAEIHSPRLSASNYFLEFSGLDSFIDRSTGKVLSAGRMEQYWKSLAVLLQDGTTFEAIPNKEHNAWQLAKNGRELGELVHGEVFYDIAGRGFFSRLIHRVFGGSFTWRVTLNSGPIGELRIDYPIGSNKTSRRLLRFKSVELPVHLSRSSDYDPACEQHDFRFPHMWDDDYVLPVGTPKCDRELLEIAFLLNVFLRTYYRLDESSS